MTNTTSSPKTATYFTFDHIRKTINGSEFNFKMSGNPGKPQYEALMEAMERHPNYALNPIASTKKVEKKQTYKGLNFDLMMDYVDFKATDIQKAEFNELVNSNETYPVIKSWFVENFKVGFSVEKAKREIASHKLSSKKKAVRSTVKAKVVKATPTVAELPTAVNF